MQPIAKKREKKNNENEPRDSSKVGNRQAEILTYWIGGSSRKSRQNKSTNG